MEVWFQGEILSDRVWVDIRGSELVMQHRSTSPRLYHPTKKERIQQLDAESPEGTEKKKVKNRNIFHFNNIVD